RDQRQQSAAGLLKKRQPLLQTVRVLEDHVGRAGKRDTPPFELLLGRMDVQYLEVENRVVVKIRHVDDRAVLEHQANSPAIEERQLVDREQVPQAEGVAVEPLGF